MSSIEAHTSLRTVSATVGRTIRLYPHDQLVRLDQTPDKITVLIRRVKAREYRYQTCFDSAELWLAQWTCDPSTGRWLMAEPVVLPDTDFVPYRRQEIGEVRDRPGEYEDRLEWEAMCARPGNGSRFGQRDSFHRTANDSPAGIQRMWSEHNTVLFHSESYEED